MNATRGLCVGLLALACCGWTGCGDGGSDGDAEEPTGETADEIAAEEAPAPETEPLPADEAPIALTAPTLIYPAAGRIFFMDDEDDEIKIRLDWTAVPGAASYALEVRDPSYNGHVVTNVHSGQNRYFYLGFWKWRVWAVDAAGTAGPHSAQFYFDVKSMPTPQP